MEDKLKGLRWYLTLVILGISFYTYSQMTGWNWFGSAPTETQSGTRSPGTYRYFFHK